MQTKIYTPDVLAHLPPLQEVLVDHGAARQAGVLPDALCRVLCRREHSEVVAQSVNGAGVDRQITALIVLKDHPGHRSSPRLQVQVLEELAAVDLELSFDTLQRLPQHARRQSWGLQYKGLRWKYCIHYLP